MKLHGLKPAAGSKKAPKRVGRDTGSGLSRDTGEGKKGQNARPGGEMRSGSEGSQMPLYRKLPKRRFTNIFIEQHVSINVDRLNTFEDGTEITPEVLLRRGVINRVRGGVRILGDGTLEKSLTIKGCKFSRLAAEKIEVVGRKVEVIWYTISPT